MPASINYQSSLRRDAPAPQFATKSLTKPAYAAYNQNHRDVLAALGGLADSQLAVDGDRAATDSELARQQSQRQLLLAGLQQMSEAGANQRSADNTRLQNLVGSSGGLLRSLFG